MGILIPNKKTENVFGTVINEKIGNFFKDGGNIMKHVLIKISFPCLTIFTSLGHISISLSHTFINYGCKLTFNGTDLSVYGGIIYIFS